MISAILGVFSEQFSLQFGPNPTAPQQIKFDRYVYWLETKLSSISCAELFQLDNILDQLSESILGLKCISTQCRSTMITYNAPQVNRIHKLYDLIDSLTDPYLPGRLFLSVSSGNYSITSLLPDAEILKDMIAENKAKLKSVEEIAASKKTEVVKFKSSKLTTSNRSDNKKASEIQSIRSEVKNILSMLDQLAAEVEHQYSVLKYFGQLKLAVHFPLQALSTHLRSLPPLAETSTQLDHDLQALNKVDTYYTMMRRAEPLIQAAVTTQEAAQIEGLVNESIAWLRLIADKEVLQLIQKVSREFTSADHNANWYLHLSRFRKLPLSDLLTLCGSVEGGSAFQSCVRNVRDVLVLISNDRQDHPHFDSMPAGLAELVVAFDAELFCAHAQDYCERRSRYENIVQRGEFTQAYKDLCAGRTAMDKAQRKYHRTAAQFEEYLALHREANIQLNQLKERCIEIALAEVSESIEFIP